MSAAKDIFEKLVSAGMEITEALALLSRYAVESAPPLDTRSLGAKRQAAWRGRNKTSQNVSLLQDENVSERNETSQSVTDETRLETSLNVTKRLETSRGDAGYISSLESTKKERKIDIPERHALHVDWKPSEEAEKIARQKNLDLAEMLTIFRNHLKSSGVKHRDYDAAFCNFMLNRRTFGGETASKSERPLNYQPTEADYDRAAALFAKSASLWSSQLGPEPGMINCRCPPEIMIRHGIDPKSGLRTKQRATA